MRCRRRSWFVGVLKPLSIVMLLFMIFTIVWLRSSVVSLEYRLSSLEKKKVELARDRKLLLAERSNLLAIGRLENTAAGSGFAFPDRMRVVYVKKGGDSNTYKASLLAKREH